MAEKLIKIVSKNKIKYHGTWVVAGKPFSAFESDVEMLKKLGCKEVKRGDVAIGADGTKEAIGGAAPATKDEEKEKGGDTKLNKAELDKLDETQLAKLCEDKNIEYPLTAKKEDFIKLLLN